MSVVASFVKGMLSVVTVTAAQQLYRYPYRSSAEGLRGDMLRVGEDMESVIGKLQEWQSGTRRRRRKRRRHG